MIAFIDEHKDEFGVEPICRELPIAPQTYYAAKMRPPSKRSMTDEETAAQIHQVHASNYRVYRARKVHAQLKRDGLQVARWTVERLMRREGLRGVRRSKGPGTTIPGALANRPEDLVDRHFTASAPDCLWVMTEALKSLFKAGLVRNLGPWKGVDDLEIAVTEYIGWFNHRRLHGELGHIPPVEAENDFYALLPAITQIERILPSLYRTRGLTEFIPAEAERISTALAAVDYLRGRDADEFSKGLAWVWGDTTDLHPFRDINTRSQFVFFTQLAAEAGWVIDWNMIDPQVFAQARTVAIFRDEEAIDALPYLALFRVEDVACREDLRQRIDQAKDASFTCPPSRSREELDAQLRAALECRRPTPAGPKTFDHRNPSNPESPGPAL